MLFKKSSFFSFLFAIMIAGQSWVFADGNCKKSCCPKCKTPCVLKVEQGTEEKHCWKIEEKVVCIPRVTFSWQWPWEKKSKGCSSGCDTDCDGSCCTPNCPPPKLARSRTVKTLVKHEYECPVCKYSWEPRSCEPCTAYHAAPAQTMAPAPAPQPTPAVQPEQPEQPAAPTADANANYGGNVVSPVVVRAPIVRANAFKSEQPVVTAGQHSSRKK
ncbi:MAG: hypothetical protein AAF483_17655 [Planctomycetota bacterium]